MPVKENLIQSKSFEFALHIISLYSQLQNSPASGISRELLKSGTSIGANIEEAIGGQSKKDFLSKVSIALKEARETRYWIRLLDESGLTDIDLKDYLAEVIEIINILSAMVKTTRKNLSQS